MLVEKRIAGINRWLERLKQSYSSGRMENALMDAECARADLEALRQTVWSKVRPSVPRGRGVFLLCPALKAAFLAALVVMTAAVPLAREVSVPAVEYSVDELVLAEPIIVVREPEQAEQTEQKPEQPRTPSRSQKQASQKRQTPAKRTASAPSPAPSPAAPAVKAKSVAYDKVFSLLQTGQRALKNNSSVIKLQ